MEDMTVINMDEGRLSKVAKALSSESCKKVLDHLSKNDKATESDIAKGLGLAMSTVHYNLRKLEEVGLVESPEYHYSEKGREVKHYTLVNKYIVISPRGGNFLDRLKEVIPLGIFAVLGYFGIRLFYDAAPAGREAVRMASETYDSASATASSAASQPDIAVWFLLGNIAVILFYLVYKGIRDRMS
ncbi:MAG: ArsR/SmtB family transcription factor [Nanobdellota archaeon]